MGSIGHGVTLRARVVAITRASRSAGSRSDLDRTVKRDDLRSLKATKVGSKGLRSLAIQLKDRPRERIASQAKLQPATKEIGNLPWQCGEPVAVEPQFPEVGELADLRGQGGELVAAEPQPPEVGELGDLGRQRGELVAVEPQVPEVGEPG